MKREIIILGAVSLFAGLLMINANSNQQPTNETQYNVIQEQGATAETDAPVIHQVENEVGESIFN